MKKNTTIYKKQDLEVFEEPVLSAKKKPSSSLDETVILGLENKKQTNKEIRRMAYVMLILLFAVIGHIVYFNAFGSRDVVNNPNNKLVAKISEKVVRGNILSSDGEILAQTLRTDDGYYYRNYPYANAFAHAVGTSDINKSGVEQYADYDLINSDINPAQKIINDIKSEKNPGNNVVTTLNASLQNLAYNLLGSNEGAIIALEPATGKTLAMVSKPDYDPNTLKDNFQSILNDSESKVLLNQATQGIFVPGSIFKIITTLAYMRSGYKPDKYSFDCEGAISLISDDGQERSISCYNGEVHGHQNLKESFADSCNASYANIGQTIKPDKMKSVCKELLFNTKLPTSIPTAKSVFDIDNGSSQWQIGATAIGQGNTQISPMHAVMLASIIANKGELMEPYIIDRIESAEGKTLRSTPPKKAGKYLSSSEASILREMMEAVVTEGTGYNIAGRSYTAAGKTGTAEVSSRGNNAWFIGYAPADDPQIAVCVLVENAGAASSVSVPIAAALFDEYFSH